MIGRVAPRGRDAPKGERPVMFSDFSEAKSFVEKRSVEMVDLKFCDLWGRWHHVTIPASGFAAGPHGEGRRLRRLERRLQVGQLGRHGPRPRPGDGFPRPLLGGPDPLVHLHDARGRHACALPLRPALDRPAGRGVPPRERRRRRELVGPGVRVLRLRRRLVRERDERRVLPRPVLRGRLELARARERLHHSEARRLPRDPAAGPALQLPDAASASSSRRWASR